MDKDVSKFIKACASCCISKPTNRNLGKYIPLLVPTRLWESISMDFIGGLPTNQRGNDYLYVIVDRFSKMDVLTPYKKSIIG